MSTKRTELRLLHRWIALTSLHEDMLTKIANHVYTIYKKNRIFDDEILDKCRSMDELFDEGRRHEKEMERNLSDVASTNKVATWLSRQFIRHNLQAYRTTLGENIKSLGLRSLHLWESRVDFTDSKELKILCKKALRYREDADGVWNEMVVFHEERKKNKGRKPESFIEVMIIGGGRLSRKLLNNEKLRGLVTKASGFEEGATEEVAQEYGEANAEA